MPLAGHVDYTNRRQEIPTESRPTSPSVGLDMLIDVTQGQQQPRRKGPDGTRWCLSCQKTLDPTSRAVHCNKCSDDLRALRARFKRNNGGGMVSIPRDQLEALDRATTLLQMLVGDIYTARSIGREVDPGVWIDLAAASKHVAYLVHDEFRPRIRR